MRKQIGQDPSFLQNLNSLNQIKRRPILNYLSLTRREVLVDQGVRGERVLMEIEGIRALNMHKHGEQLLYQRGQERRQPSAGAEIQKGAEGWSE